MENKELIKIEMPEFGAEVVEFSIDMSFYRRISREDAAKLNEFFKEVIDKGISLGYNVKAKGYGSLITFDLYTKRITFTKPKPINKPTYKKGKNGEILL